MNSTVPMICKSFRKATEAHGKTPAQAAFRRHLQKDIIAVPKSFTLSRIGENFNVIDFELSAEEMEQMITLNKDRRTL